MTRRTPANYGTPAEVLPPLLDRLQLPPRETVYHVQIHLLLVAMGFTFTLADVHDGVERRYAAKVCLGPAFGEDAEHSTRCTGRASKALAALFWDLLHGRTVEPHANITAGPPIRQRDLVTIALLSEACSNTMAGEDPAVTVRHVIADRFGLVRRNTPFTDDLLIEWIGGAVYPIIAALEAPQSTWSTTDIELWGSAIDLDSRSESGFALQDATDVEKIAKANLLEVVAAIDRGVPIECTAEGCCFPGVPITNGDRPEGLHIADSWSIDACPCVFGGPHHRDCDPRKVSA